MAFATTTTQQINPHATHCICTLRDDGIYVFTIVQGTHQATDEWLMHLDTLYASVAPGSSVRYIMDYRAGVMPSLVYSANKARQWLHANGNLRQGKTRVAFIHNASALISMVETVVRLLRVRWVTARFFTAEDKAIAWLLSE